MYSELIKEHFQNPRCTEPLTKYTHYNSLSNVTCNDRVEFFLNLEAKDSGFLVHGVHIKVLGCGLSIAAASILASQIIIKNYITRDFLTADVFLSGLRPYPAGKEACIIVALDCLLGAIK
ncbi:iron-sulfur cluster assembly scaffold protein [Candidatus Riflebacteria bacterium]